MQIAEANKVPATAAADALLAAAVGVAATVGTAAAAGTGTAAAGCAVGCPAEIGFAVWPLCAAPGTAQRFSYLET